MDKLAKKNPKLSHQDLFDKTAKTVFIPHQAKKSFDNELCKII